MCVVYTSEHALSGLKSMVKWLDDHGNTGRNVVWAGIRGWDSHSPTLMTMCMSCQPDMQVVCVDDHGMPGHAVVVPCDPKVMSKALAKSGPPALDTLPVLEAY